MDQSLKGKSQHLVESMPQRIEAVLRAKGDSIHQYGVPIKVDSEYLYAYGSDKIQPDNVAASLFQI